MSAPGAASPKTIVGPLMDAGKYLIKAPESWNGTLILYSFGPPVPAENPVFDAAHPVMQAYLQRGYAVAGWSSPVFWPLEQSFPNQMTVLDEFARLVGKPERTIAYGQSIGGFLTAGLAQRFPSRLDGALAVCGPIAGGIATQNRELDVAFVFKTLVAPESDLELVLIREPERNQALALELLEGAARTPLGRARLALTAAVTNVPGWPDPRSPEPATADHAARLDGQIGWFRGIVFHVIFNARATIERRAGGNPSWNTDVDYAALLERSLNADVVRWAYAAASVDLESDLERLTRAPRVTADPKATEYLERYIVFNGDLADIPVVTVHTTGDGLCTPDHEHAYRDVVRSAGHAEQLRQLWIRRGGHCSFSVAETLAALDVLLDRVTRGSWPATDASTLNGAARRLESESRLLNPLDEDDRDPVTPVPPGFCEFEPPPFSRPYDARSLSRRSRGAHQPGGG